MTSLFIHGYDVHLIDEVALGAHNFDTIVPALAC